MAHATCRVSAAVYWPNTPQVVFQSHFVSFCPLFEVLLPASIQLRSGKGYGSLDNLNNQHSPARWWTAPDASRAVLQRRKK